MMDKLSDIPVRYLKGIGPKRAKTLNKLGIRTAEDLLYYFPRRYEDRTKFSAIAELQEGQIQTVKAQVLAKSERRSFRGRRFSILEVAVGDQTGKIFCVWFNQPYLKEYFKAGQALILYGRIERYKDRLQINSPEFEIIEAEQEEPRPAQQGRYSSLNTGRIVPVYSLPEGITQRYFRQLMKNILDEYLPKVNDFLPFDIRSRNNLLNLAKAMINIHFPDSPDTQRKAYARLAFEEFFLFQLPLVLRKLKNRQRAGIAHIAEGRLVKDFIGNLDFKLTRAQQKVVEEITSDLRRPFMMQRLLQGDVGSGKTVVATVAGLIAIQGGYQAAFMVPTEILAKQHFSVVSGQLSGVSKKIKIALLISSLDKKKKEKVYKEIKSGGIDLIIGTHALLEETVRFKNLGFVVIDEQHKFGVGQRALLPEKGINPDILIMTATPIPRTLAITLYADLDISVINELPPGRLPVKTMHLTQPQQDQAYEIVKKQVQQGNQAYIVYPVIEDSYALDISGAKKMYAQLKAGPFKEFRLGLIHGKLTQKEQDRIMLKFKNKELDILVSTTVLEVGIDVPSATCMLVEYAERFGLAQLHQLRGRVGRGLRESFCVLISGAQTEEARQRIEAMVKYNDGFRIAEEDLRIRGPGEFFGARQHGLSELKIGDPLTQMHLLKRAREEAVRLLNLDPHLQMRQNILLGGKLLQRFPGYEKLIAGG